MIRIVAGSVKGKASIGCHWPTRASRSNTGQRAPVMRAPFPSLANAAKSPHGASGLWGRVARPTRARRSAISAPSGVRSLMRREIRAPTRIALTRYSSSSRGGPGRTRVQGDRPCTSTLGCGPSPAACACASRGPCWSASSRWAWASAGSFSSAGCSRASSRASHCERSWCRPRSPPPPSCCGACSTSTGTWSPTTRRRACSRGSGRRSTTTSPRSAPPTSRGRARAT